MPSCPICKQPVKVFNVYTYKTKKFRKVKSVCLPCKEKEDKQLFERLIKKEVIKKDDIQTIKEKPSKAKRSK